MAARHVTRTAAWSLVCVATPLALRTTFGRPWGAIGFAIVLAATVVLVLWLPRAAHRAFTTGKVARAHRRYRVCQLVAFTAARERAAELSRTACLLDLGRGPAAAALLATLERADLDPAERVVYLNNRACAALDAETDPVAALALVDEATALRPDVPAVQHTRARALLAVGRIDDAITVLDAMRTGGELPARLEAERCRDLATAWERKGQPAYADDYRDRARLHAS
ncbi:MAG: tetratricopeptide repeat protein [Kofleriaceae bacterium]